MVSIKVSGFCFLTILLMTINLSAQKAGYSDAQIKILKDAKEMLAQGAIEKDNKKMAEAYYTFGKIESNIHNYLASQQWFLKSLKILEKEGASYELGRLYLRMHENEILQTHRNKARQYLETSLKIFEDCNSKKGLALAYSSFGNFYKNTKTLESNKQLDSALYFYKKSQLLYHHLKDDLGVAGTNLAFANLYLSQNDGKAVAYYEKALKIFTEKKQTATELQILLALSTINIKNKNLNVAQDLIKKAEVLNVSVDNYESQKSLARVYLQYYKEKEDFKNALKYQDILHNLEKQDLIQDQKGAVTELNIAYETDQKDKEIIAKRDIIIEQKQFLIGSILLILIASGASVLYYLLYKKNEKTAQKNQALLKEQNHRIKNNLQSVSSLLSLQANRLKDKEAKKVVDESKLRIEVISSIHHRLYDGDDLTKVQLSGFIKEIVYGVLNTFGFYELHPVFVLEETMVAADQTLSIGLIINELTTNACKYAFKNQNSQKLTIKSFYKNDNYQIEFCDSGVAEFDCSSLNITTELHKSFGVRLIQTQVIQLQGTYEYYKNQGLGFKMSFKPLSEIK